MRIGTFFGLTAPMLVLAYDGDMEKMHDIVSKLEESIDRDIVRDLHTELHFLLKANDMLSVRFEIPGDSWFSDREPDAMVMHGQITGISTPADVAYIDLKNELTVKLAQRIVDKEQTGKFVKLDNMSADGLEEFVVDYINNNDFYASGIQRLIMSMYQQIKSDDGKPLTDELVNGFRNTKQLPDNLIHNSADVELNEVLRKIFWYFNRNLVDIQRLYDTTKMSSIGDITVFNMPFSDLMHYKPSKIEDIAIQWFHYFSENKSLAALQNVVDDFRQSLNTLIMLIDSAVVTDGPEVNSEPTFDASSYSIYSVFPEIAQYTQDEADSLNNIYEKVCEMTPKVAAERIGITEDEFRSAAKDACNIGICGLNAYSLELFKDTLPNVVVSDGFSCHKSLDYMTNLKKSIENATKHQATW